MQKEEKLVLKNKLRVARAEKNMSQGTLAETVGVSRQTISSIETGHFNPTAKLALMFCIALDKKFEDLFFFEIAEVPILEETEELAYDEMNSYEDEDIEEVTVDY